MSFPHQAPPTRSDGRTSRLTTLTTWSSIVVLFVSFLILVRALPVDRALSALETAVGELGAWGPIVFGAAYIMAALLFIPGSALTLAAGALFGPMWGTAIVSAASTTAAGAAFLIARYVARERVARSAARYPKFAAIDEAIGQGGGKIVAMLRLSPAVPFSLGNYLYGLTAIRFWPYLLASWVFMLPGTFLYIYLGHVGKEGLAAASNAPATKTPAEWALLAVGLLATVVVTVYVTRLARKSIREHTRIEQAPASVSESTAENVERNEAPARRSLSTILMPTMAVIMLAAAVYASSHRDTLQGLFGRAPITLGEAYADTGSSARFDHSEFDALLRRHVDGDGWVDYAALRQDAAKLDAYIKGLAGVSFDELGRDEKLALLINAYNAFTLRLILDYYPIDSIKDIPGSKRWRHKRWRVGADVWSLDQIEHEQIRPKFAEPRIHFALVCAAVGCPKLRNEAYAASRVDEQLEDQMRYAHTHDRWLRFDRDRNVVHLTKLYDWYGSDFKQSAETVLAFAARYSDDLKRALATGKKPRISWLKYDWKLNDKTNRQ